MKKKYFKFFFIVFVFLITFLYASIWGYENPESIEKLNHQEKKLEKQRNIKRKNIKKERKEKVKKVD